MNRIQQHIQINITSWPSEDHSRNARWFSIRKSNDMNHYINKAHKKNNVTILGDVEIEFDKIQY